jgi:hypothetical protein
MDGQAAIALVRTASLSSLVEAEVMRLILSSDLQAGQQIKDISIATRLVRIEHRALPLEELKCHQSFCAGSPSASAA